MLSVARLSKSFGGVAAVSDVTFSVAEGTIHAVIGPNGAGKTTLFNLITGLVAPTSGSIRLRGEEVAGLPPESLARRGVARTFQSPQVSMNLSAIENVMVGAHLRLDAGLLAAMARRPRLVARDRAARAEAADWLALVGCAAYVGAEARAMPYGALKRLEIARALAAKPELLFLDEPAAGLNPAETDAVERLIAEIGRSGVTVVLVEHDMKLVMNVAERIVVLDYGKKLAEGAPDEVRANPDVIAAYLGAADGGA